MRIVYYAHSVLNRGGDKMVLAHLRCLADSGHRITICSNVVATEFPLHPAFDFGKPLLPGKIGTLAGALLQRHSCDLVLATIVPTALLLRLRNRRVVYFAQDDNETAYPYPMSLVFRVMYLLLFRTFLIPTITVSLALAESFAARFGARCQVVENGVDTAVFYPSLSGQLEAKKQGRKAILLYARSDRRKGGDLAHEVVARVAAAAAHIEVWTVGEDIPWPHPSVRHRFFGTVSEGSLCEIMSSADLFLYPSRSEGFPLMVLEAFACGCPVVTTTAVSFARDEENALVAPVEDVAALADRVERLLADKELEAHIKEEGRRFASAHSLAESSGNFEARIAGLFPAAE